MIGPGIQAIGNRGPEKDTMDFLSFQIAVISVLSPVLLGGGILFLISTAQITTPAIALNLLAASMAGLRFAVDLPENVKGLLTVFFGFFLILALAANARAIALFLTKTPKLEPEVRTRSSVPKGEAAVQPKVPGPSVMKGDESKRVRVLSPTCWLLNNEWCDIRVFKLPTAIAEKNSELMSSARQFRIAYDEEAEPVEESFAISQNLEILLPGDIVNRLQTRELIRFEILN